MFSARCHKCGNKGQCMYSTPPGGDRPIFICPACMLKEEKTAEGK